MSEQKQKYQAYAAATQTVARTKQIVLLYDGVIRFLKQAKDAIGENRIEDRYNLLIKASEIIGGLQASLDFENGGEVAKILYSFYASIDGRIFSVHRTNSIDTCDQIIAELKQMRDVWQDIDDSGAVASAAEQKPSNVPPVPPADGVVISA